MDRELASTEIQIQEKAKQLLEGLQALAILSSEIKIASLVCDLEILAYMLSCDSELISSTREIKELYEKAITHIETFYIGLQSILTQDPEVT